MTTLSPFSGSPASGLDVGFPTPPVVEANPASQSTTNATKPAAKKPRKRVNTAEKRHQHNAIERQRRETLNGKFIVLARLLPSLANHRRPSKSAIVNGSIAHLTYQRDQRLLAAKLLRQIASEHDALLNEVNEWRKTSGYASKESSCAWTAGIDEVCSVEKEVFGTFNNVDGDDNEDDDQDDMPSLTMPHSVTPQVFTQSTGLITPRPSTDVASAQALLNGMLIPESRNVTATASNVGLDWSSDFAWTMNNGSRPMDTANVHAHSNVFAFPGFVNESVDTSSTDSPATSQHGTVLTPPTYTDILNNHTPSPRSSNGMSAIEETKPVIPQGQQSWTPAQMLFAHQQLQLQRQQQAQQGSAFPPSFNFNNVHTPLQTPTPESDLFTQQLMASMFPPQQTTSALQLQAQLEQWRKSMAGNVRRATVPHQTSVHDLREAVRLGMGMQWQESQSTAVEGF